MRGRDRFERSYAHAAVARIGDQRASGLEREKTKRLIACSIQRRCGAGKRFERRFTEETCDDQPAALASRVRAARRTIDQHNRKTRIVDADPRSATVRVNGRERGAIAASTRLRRACRRPITPFVTVAEQPHAVAAGHDADGAHGLRRARRRRRDAESWRHVHTVPCEQHRDQRLMMNRVARHERKLAADRRPGDHRRADGRDL